MSRGQSPDTMEYDMKLTIEIPETVTVEAGEASEEFAFANIAEDALQAFVESAVVIAVRKAGNDSASGAKEYAKKHKLDVDDARAELIGKWCQARYDSGKFDRAASGFNAVEREAISMCLRAAKEADEKRLEGA